LQNRIDLLLKNFPKPSKVPDKFMQYKLPIHLICSGLAYRKLAKDIAICLVRKYIEDNRVIYPPIYLTKSQFINGWRDFLFINGQKPDKWKKASVVVFDGLDEANNQTELQYISSFISQLIVDKTPFILISCNKISEQTLRRYNAMSFGVQLLDIEVVNINES